jgi:selenocysteine lyase/cysteine desulfurase
MGGIAALGASLELLLEVGIDAIAARVKELTDALCEGARRRGLEVFSSRQGADWSGIVSLIPPPGVEPAALVRRCRQAGAVVSARGGRLRVSPHAYNTPDEVDRLCLLLGGGG